VSRQVEKAGANVDSTTPHSNEQLAGDFGHTPASQSVPTIVVVAHDRPKALERLLDSLRHLRTPQNKEVHLAVSVDGSVTATLDVAQRVEWPFGTKEVIARGERMGLHDHVLACGDLSAKHGTILMLEDDLYVSPDAYTFAMTASAFYASQEAIAGLSLYAYRLDEYQRLAFLPLDNGYDTFFMQMPSSWGQVWTPDQWDRFRTWYDNSPSVPDSRLPAPATRWPKSTSWKRAFLAYLIDTDRYFAFPNRSLTTNCGDAGEHSPRATTNFISPLSEGPRRWRLAPWQRDAIRYDAWFEPMPDVLASKLPDVSSDDVTIDLRGGKRPEQVDTAWLLSSRPCSAPEASYPLLLQPEALNLDLQGQGNFFHLGPSTAFGEMPRAKHRRLIEMLNGEITHQTAVGILFDRLTRRIRRGL